MPTRRTYQVKQVARLTGLTIRTLHHYDAIGLLAPSARSAAGYRLYDDDDLLRLQQILIGRELGLSLEAIRRSLDDPRFDRRQALLAQRTELEARTARTTTMIRAIDAALTAIEENDMSKVDLKKIFDGFDPEQYADEAEERWGHTDAYRISAERTKAYSAADWQRFKEEQGRSTRMRSLRVRPACAPMSRVRWTSRSGIGCRSTVGSTRAARRCTAALRTCGKPIGAMRTTSTSSGGAGLTEYLAAAVRANASARRPERLTLGAPSAHYWLRCSAAPQASAALRRRPFRLPCRKCGAIERQRPMQSIDDGAFVNVNGVPQWLTCAGPIDPIPRCYSSAGRGPASRPSRRSLPPGNASSRSCSGISRAGASRSRSTGAEATTVARLVDDGLRVAELARERLQVPKLALLGLSGGTIVGLEMVRRRPELFSAYIGSGQIVDWARQDAASYALLLARARALRDETMLRELTAIGPPPPMPTRRPTP